MIYRAKRKDGGELVHGYYLGGNGSWIVACGNTIQYDDYEDMLKVWGGAYEIDPATLAMSTGILDKHKVEIFGSIASDGLMSVGGDRVKAVSNKPPFEEVSGDVEYSDGEWLVITDDSTWPVASMAILNSFEIIGTQMDKEVE